LWPRRARADWLFPLAGLNAVVSEAQAFGLTVAVSGGKLPASTEPDDTADDEQGEELGEPPVPPQSEQDDLDDQQVEED
jgi:hypothetical protein